MIFKAWSFILLHLFTGSIVEKRSYVFFQKWVAGEAAKQCYLYRFNEGKWDTKNWVSIDRQRPIDHTILQQYLLQVSVIFHSCATLPASAAVECSHLS